MLAVMSLKGAALIEMWRRDHVTGEHLLVRLPEEDNKHR
jgi:hypothetical protein